MNTTATQTEPQWGTWKDLGNSSALVYHGRNKAEGPWAEGTFVVVGQTPTGWSMLTSDGTPVAQGGYASRFWATRDYSAPVNQPDEPRVPAQRQATSPTTAGDPAVATTKPTEDAKAINRAARPGRNSKLHACLCGCGGQVKGLYKQGHDARHAADVARRMIAAGSDANLTEFLQELPTEALRVKAANIVAKRVR